MTIKILFYFLKMQHVSYLTKIRVNCRVLNREGTWTKLLLTLIVKILFYLYSSILFNLTKFETRYFLKIHLNHKKPNEWLLNLFKCPVSHMIHIELKIRLNCRILNGMGTWSTHSCWKTKCPFLDVHLYIIFILDIGLKSPLLEGLGILWTKFTMKLCLFGSMLAWKKIVH